MNTTIKQIIATAIIITIGTFFIRAAIDLVSLTIDNPTTHLVVSIGLVLWITMLLIWLLSRVLIALRDQPPSNKHRQMIFTDSQLLARERNERLLSQNDTSHDLAHLYNHDEHQERLKRKYAIK